jgi:hypothetical protein
MKRFHLLAFMVAAACGGKFDPDLSGVTEGADDTGSDTASTDDTNSTDDTATTNDSTDDTGTGGPDCGDGLAEGDEECDGLDLRGMECTGLPAPEAGNFHGGTLACADDCTFDTDACQGCGEGEVQGDEECDDADLDGATCEDEGFDGGTLTCDACVLDSSTCENCVGDPDGKYGKTETHPECGLMGDLMDNEGTHIMVCYPSCETDEDCEDPSLDPDLCGAQPTCMLQANLCFLVCHPEGDDCPDGMFCNTYATQTPYCAWEV